MGNGLFAGNMGSLRSNSFSFSRGIRLDRFALAAGHDLAGAGRLRWNDDSAIFRVDGRDRRVRMDRACFRPRPRITSPFWDRLLAEKKDQRKEKLGLLQMYHLPVRFWCTC